MISCITSCSLREFSELFKIGFFVESILFFWNWSLGFSSILIYSWYMLVNLIYLGFCEKLKILGFVLNPIWGFGSIRLKLMKLACWFDVVDHSNLFSNLCNDQLVNFFKNIQVVLNFLGFYLENLCSNQVCEFELNLDLIYCLRSCIMSFNLFMRHIVLFVLYCFWC